MENIEMTKEGKEAKAKYMRKYRQRPEVKARQKVYTARYWEKKAKEEQDK